MLFSSKDIQLCGADIERQRESVYLHGGFAKEEETFRGRHTGIIMIMDPKAEAQETEQTKVHARHLIFYYLFYLAWE